MFAGFPGADTQNYGYWHSKKVPLHDVTFIAAEAIHDGHDPQLVVRAFGLMTAARWTVSATTRSRKASGSATWPYAYLKRSEVKPYWDMASQYVLADHMFPTMFGGSFTAHLDLISGTTDLAPKVSEVDWPDGSHWGCDANPGTTTSLVTPTQFEPGAGPFPCFTQFRTMADTLDAAKVSWKYYAPAVNSGDVGGSRLVGVFRDQERTLRCGLGESRFPSDDRAGRCRFRQSPADDVGHSGLPGFGSFRRE